MDYIEKGKKYNSNNKIYQNVIKKIIINYFKLNFFKIICLKYFLNIPAKKKLLIKKIILYEF